MGPAPGGPPAGRPPRPKGKYAPRRKVCQFCVEKLSHIDYKDLMRLRRFLSDRAKIEPRRKTGTCAKHQRRLSTALKRARMIGLLPFTGEHLRQMGGMIQPIPGMPSVPERPYPPRDSFGPSGSQPGGVRPPEQRGDGAPPADGPAAPAQPPQPAEGFRPAPPAAEGPSRPPFAGPTEGPPRPPFAGPTDGPPRPPFAGPGGAESGAVRPRGPTILTSGAR